MPVSPRRPTKTSSPTPTATTPRAATRRPTSPTARRSRPGATATTTAARCAASAPASSPRLRGALYHGDNLSLLRAAIPDASVDLVYLDQAARWLAKSEANLNSAFDESPESDLGNIRLEQARTEEAIARFMEMCGGNPERRLSVARTYREEGLELLGSSA